MPPLPPQLERVSAAWKRRSLERRRHAAIRKISRCTGLSPCIVEAALLEHCRARRKERTEHGRQERYQLD